MNNKKSVLAIETSEITCGVCIYFSDDKFFSSSINLKHSHSEKIFEIIDWLFQVSKIKPEDLDSIAISAGPGSFTGLRIGMAAAKGIAYGSGLPLVPVPTYEAFAFQLTQVLTDNSQFVIANKVNKDEVYFAKFQIKGNSYIFVDDLAVRKNESFIDVVGRLPVFGNAAVLLSENLKFPVSPDPRFIAKWAIEYGENSKTFDYDFLEPNYLKNFLIKENSK
ncbi:MAG: tRNA (adenosine(37)-N6)-threonylcarbamoyltransferase complex dimerization subunit type 1 TsaB [Ignavibacteriaceae bacterium]|nr:tRNA (adenosine(37)-N6)-threonylcarbamoyltransferase complex dimerization subunit type 1 TsaB [Ignavibacteria bacterium]NNJ52448.1 tRNA (adenosine(37)-N6)-threonylcarbamoyltransferase complex dimerization subunit type 1 TsaB [Ignavibacteriaceae bacterium]